MKQDVNYIIHHKNVNIKLMEDDVSCIDVSIYNALFLLWNRCDFDTDLSINRNDVMKLSKVGNANTYTKSLKKLHEKKYIIYKPSNNPLIGSKVTITRYDKGIGKGIGKGSDIGSGKGCDTLYKQVNKETTKQINNEFLECEILEYSFEDFWKLYPNKNGKKVAKEKFEKLTKEQKEKIEQTLPIFITNIPFKDYSFPHASTYLNQERYNDEIILNNNKNGKSKITSTDEFKQIADAIRQNGGRK